MSIRYLFDTYRLVKFKLILSNCKLVCRSDNVRIAVIYQNLPEGVAVEKLLTYKFRTQDKIDTMTFDFNANFSLVSLINIFRSIEDILKHQFSDITKYKFLYVGETKGFLTKELIKFFDCGRVIEIQHGQLDESYFPIKSNLFIARDSIAYKILLENQSTNKTIHLFNDFNIDNSHYLDINKHDVNVVYWGKNPGGGVTWSKLVQLEKKIFICFFQELTQVKLHPRDNLLKFFFRHLFFGNFRVIYIYFLIGSSVGRLGEILNIGSNTTSLIDKTNAGEYLLNIMQDNKINQNSNVSLISSMHVDDLSISDTFRVSVK